MSTWAGAIVETRSESDLRKVAQAHQITIESVQSGWQLIDSKVGMTNLNTPRFAESLSRELQATVIGFFQQTSASVQLIEHWEKGALLRKLAYSGDQGGWITQEGAQQEWEPLFFFVKGEGIGAGQAWPLNLADDITENEKTRYESAQALQNPSQVMDLLGEGSIQRVCAHFGVDPEKPNARFSPSRSQRRSMLMVALIALIALVAAFFVLAITC